MDDEKIIMGQNKVWKIKRNNDISKKVWMMKKKSWVRTKYGR